MGLSTFPEGWEGPYSSFGEWRRKVGVAAGYDLEPFSIGDFKSERVVVDYDSYPEEAAYGDWDSTPDDPLMVLFVHSDCEGKIYPAQAGPLADRLEEVLPEIPEAENTVMLNYWKRKTQTFIDGLRECVDEDKPMRFR